MGTALADILFQFQFGTIDRNILESSSGTYSLFQFQFGTIDSAVFAYFLEYNILVSIPVWYDW